MKEGSDMLSKNKLPAAESVFAAKVAWSAYSMAFCGNLHASYRGEVCLGHELLRLTLRYLPSTGASNLIQFIVIYVVLGRCRPAVICRCNICFLNPQAEDCQENETAHPAASRIRVVSYI